MSQQTLPQCAAGLTSADLSAWRDDLLSADDTARIGAHSQGCRACQERLEGFETIATALHAQRVPAPGERLWQAVATAISADMRTPDDAATARAAVVSSQPAKERLASRPPAHRSWRARALGTLAAAAAITLVVVGFGQLFQFGAGDRSATAFSVKWRQVTLPTELSPNAGSSLSVSVFPADGSIAWICQSGTSARHGDLRIWRTIDGGATWKRMGTPRATPVTACQIHLDQLDPDTAILDFAQAQSNPGQTVPAIFSTFDGGAHWHNDPLILPMTEFATLHGTTYAIRQDGTDANRLEMGSMSANQNTWTYIDASLHELHLTPSRFWINPTTGGLLVQAIFNGAVSLWTADATGSHWQSLSTPPMSTVTAQPTADGQHWNICMLTIGTEDTQQPPDFISRFTCGTEQTTSWVTRPGLDFPRSSATRCPTCATPNVDPYGAVTLLGIANDGALLAMAQDRFDANAQPTRTSLYRLPSGSSHWQNGGALPESGAIYTPRPGGGLFWSMPASAGSSETLGPLFTASYPDPALPPTPTQAQSTQEPTGNVDNGAPLEWQPINQPTGFQSRLTDSNVLAVAPSDGSTAYACGGPSPASLLATTPLAWVTHNGGATWTKLTLPPALGWCSPVVDEVNPRDVLMGVSRNPSPGNPPDTYYRSTDGGATWRRITSLDGSLVYQFASHNGTAYALRVEKPLDFNAAAHLQASGDNMSTWHTIEGNTSSTGLQVRQFWLNPNNGELLATNVPASVPSAPSNGISAAIWRSSDGGAHWSSLQVPREALTTVLAQPPQPNHTWGLCLAGGASGNPSSNVLICGDDSGQAWQNMPALDTGNATAVPIYAAFTSDGAVLALTPTTTSNASTTYTVYRLLSGAPRWQNIGPTPEFSLLYAPAPDGNGMLWSMPVNGIITDPQSRIFRVAAP